MSPIFVLMVVGLHGTQAIDYYQTFEECQVNVESPYQICVMQIPVVGELK
jgi:hypothetical protein